MCGLAGIFHIGDIPRNRRDILNSMIGQISYRGPDNKSMFLDKNVCLGHVRLGIIDLDGGNQPIHNENGTVHVVFTGEIFNYIELKKQLLSRGHQFYTKSDTEVIVHAYEEYGVDFVSKLNGQFAIALWDKTANKLVLARDRLGIRPLYYCFFNGALYFSSEIKSLFQIPGFPVSLDMNSLVETFTFWTTLPGKTSFNQIYSLEPSHIMVQTVEDQHISRYWDWAFPDETMDFCDFERSTIDLLQKIRDAVRLQLRSDVPVGVYLSGGLDSTIIYNLVKEETGGIPDSFSIIFEDEDFNEQSYQELVAGRDNARHHSVVCNNKTISEYFPRVISHLETPVLRTAPVPLFLLAKHVKEKGLKVVLTGEGADEVFCGYDIFKESALRKHYRGKSNESMVQRLFSRIYPYLRNISVGGNAFSSSYFIDDIKNLPYEYLTHVTRWKSTARIQRFLQGGDDRPYTDINSAISMIHELLPPGINDWSILKSGQYIEALTLLSGYILNSQGDRVSMAHGVEGRYPFLDHNLIEYVNTLPDNYKLFGLKEKFILKKAMRDYIPEKIATRPKQPYRAPDIKSFINNEKPIEYVEYLFSENRLRDSGIFDPLPVRKFYNKCKKGYTPGFVDNMSFVGILSTMILDEIYVKNESLSAT